jgi:hypothetical protein
MTSVGYTSAIGGSNVSFNIFALNPHSSGGAIQGWSPQQIQTVDRKYSEFEQIRFTLKEAWNTSYRNQLKNSNLSKPIIGSFRAVNNAGDLLSRKNFSCGGSCQTYQSRPGLKGLRQKFGSTQNTCIPSVIYSNLQLNDSIPSATCNVKYVYDSSDYTTFLKQKAVNKNFNDISNGGDQFNGSQSKLRASRRY